MDWLSTNWEAVGAIIFFAISEIIGLNPKWKENSVTGVILWIGRRIFKKEVK
jgi:hypothetical protein